MTDVSIQRRIGAAMLLTGLLALLFVTALPKGDAGAAPGGNNGTIKIDGFPYEDFPPNNEPHVPCDWRIVFYNFDAGATSQITVEAHPPTQRDGDDQLVGEAELVLEDDPPGGAGNDIDGAITAEEIGIDLSGITPHPQQGYHLKVTTNTTWSNGSDVKHKVFWVEPCAAPGEPQIFVDKTAAPIAQAAPGGSFTFSVSVTNTGDVPVTITSLVDDIYGDITVTTGDITATDCDDLIGDVLDPGETSDVCSFDAPFTGESGDSQTDIVTGTAVDEEGTEVTDDDDAIVFLTGEGPGISVDKQASPLSRPAPGGAFTFSVNVTNIGDEDVTITELVDDIYGDITTIPGTTCDDLIGVVLSPGETSDTCTFTGNFVGDSGDSQTDIVTGTAEDTDNNEVTDTDDATVRLTGGGDGGGNPTTTTTTTIALAPEVTTTTEAPTTTTTTTAAPAILPNVVTPQAVITPTPTSPQVLAATASRAPLPRTGASHITGMLALAAAALAAGGLVLLLTPAKERRTA